MAKTLRQKTFTGCSRCRARKVKCDQTKPACVRCTNIHKDCPGYRPVFIWVPPNQEISKVQGLGGLPSDQTWHGHGVYNLCEIERMLDEIDQRVQVAGSRAVFDKRSCPFSVLDLQLNVPLSNRPENPISQRLFHHYTTIIAPMMMPLESPRNPWKTYYPTIASNQDTALHTAVWNAILSQAAAHLSHLGSDKDGMRELAIQYRLVSIRILRACIVEGEDLAFELVLASILSLIFAEVYEGDSSSWRQHFLGAWKFATGRLYDQPWASSEMAWLTAQSLCMIRLRTITSFTSRGIINVAEREGIGDKSLVRSVIKRPDFGFTAGTSPEVAACLHDCNFLIQEIRADNSRLTGYHGFQITELTDRLLLEAKSNSTNPSESDLVILHNRIFALGTIIYLHRETHNPPPSALLRYTSSLFQAVINIMDIIRAGAHGTSPAIITLWPVFMASVESYRRVELNIAENWLRSLSASGIGIRTDIRRVVEEVWSERARTAALLGSADASLESNEEMLGNITVNWHLVMQGMGLDLLLV